MSFKFTAQLIQETKMPGIVVFAHQCGIPAHQLTRLLYANFSSQAAVNSGSFSWLLTRSLSALAETLY
jgi:hypothetical protein